MAGGNLRDDLSSDDLVGQFTGRPVGDRATGVLGGFASHGDDQGDLIGRVGATSSGSGLIPEDVHDRMAKFGGFAEAFEMNQVVKSISPTLSPDPDGVAFTIESLGDAMVASAVKSVEDHGGTLGDPLGTPASMNHLAKDFLLLFGHRAARFLPSHGDLLLRKIQTILVR